MQKPFKNLGYVKDRQGVIMPVVLKSVLMGHQEAKPVYVKKQVNKSAWLKFQRVQA